MKLLEGRPIPIFPLPELVLYPRIVQPLHVFEPRYREMLEDVLNSYGKIAIAVLRPGYEKEYHGSPAIWPVVGVGSLLAYEKRPDGTSDILLVGESRARVVEEVPGKTYRRAVLLELRDRAPSGEAERERLRRPLARWFRQLARSAGDRASDALEKLQESFASEEDIGFLVDFLAFHFIRRVDVRRHLLEELDVAKRAESLLEELAAA